MKKLIIVVMGLLLSAAPGAPAASEETKDQQTLDALQSMVQAYTGKDIQGFMAGVAPDFALGRGRLEQAVRRDFAALGTVTIRYAVRNVTRAASGRTTVTISFQRSVASRKTGKMLNDTGETQFIFQPDNNAMKLYAMKAPVIFGISLRDSLASGAVTSRINNPAVRIYINPVTDDIALGADMPRTTAVQAGGSTVSLAYNNIGGFWCESFVFATGSKITDSVDPRSNDITGSFTVFDDSHLIITGPGIRVQNLGFQSITSVISAPTSGYGESKWPSALRAMEGNCYAFQLPGGAYGLIEVTKVGNPTLFRYRYSPSGPGF